MQTRPLSRRGPSRGVGRLHGNPRKARAGGATHKARAGLLDSPAEEARGAAPGWEACPATGPEGSSPFRDGGAYG